MRLETFTGTESPNHEAGEVERAAPVTQKLFSPLVTPWTQSAIMKHQEDKHKGGAEGVLLIYFPGRVTLYQE